ncbi:MAG TPA: cell surface protein SprA, partial [Chitinophagaceae bacterium]|nr:cell surface protein SprA [Chitinophagaceae bacterium]
MTNRLYRISGQSLCSLLCFLCIWTNGYGISKNENSFNISTISSILGTDTTATDTTKKDTLHFPIYDYRAPSFFHYKPYSIDLKPPLIYRDSVRYNPNERQYNFNRGNRAAPTRNASAYSFDEYLHLKGQQQERNYWQQRRNTYTNLNRIQHSPDLYYGADLFNRLFGGTAATISPKGNMSVTMGYERQNFKNPILPERARITGGPNFDMDINLNIQGQIGKNLRLTSTYNTNSVFSFDKQIKLEYTGDKNSIVQKVEAGNVSFPLRSELISGVRSLFGIKTKLKFGRLTVTNIFSIQKSKKKNIVLQGGAQTHKFDKQADQYQDNQHFFLSQYFRDHYNEAMSTLPHINSQIHITRIQVWVTNKRGATTRSRDIVGLMDLGEHDPYNSNITSLGSNPMPRNDANDEFKKVTSNATFRNSGLVINRLKTLNLAPVQDFEKTYARLLDSTEYTVNDMLGYISLNRKLRPDEVLAVAFQYTYNGEVYQVGEFASNVTPKGKLAQPQILFLKLLKATSARPSLPIWDLMMKNIYSIDNFQVNREDFHLEIFYQDPGGGEKRYLPDAQGMYKGKMLLSILNLDRLNSQNDPQPDGVFDFVNGYTIDKRRGFIIFPVLQPFGSALDKVFNGDSVLAGKYKYQKLYDSTLTIARQFPQNNRFIIRGSYKASSSSVISLNGFNIPKGSVTITAGGQQLIENVDYTINYSMGTVQITNEAILNSGLPINIHYEDNASFGQQTRNYFGMRLNYKVNNKLTLGASLIRMTEKPYFSIVSYNQDPIANTIGGVDFNYRSDLPDLTRFINSLRKEKTQAESHITASGEVARLFPGHSKLIGKGSQGTIYLDDFEGASYSYDLRNPFNSWHLASTPQKATDPNGNILFPEASLTDSLKNGYKRALLSWYSIEPELISGERGTPEYLLSDKESYLGHYVRQVRQQDVFPKKSVDYGHSFLNTLDLAYYPKQRGPYNYVTNPTKVNAKGKLTQPEKNWGGITRTINNTDFETSNVQYIEFWVMDPFINDPNAQGGDLYINLGNISEDVLKDGKMAFENGMPKPAQQAQKTDTSVWGRTPRFQEQITNAFDNDPEARAYQDVGYDGLGTEQEKVFHKAYLQALLQTFGASSEIYQKAVNDPSNDDYHFYRGKDYDEKQLGILERYKRFDMPDGNSPIASGNQRSHAATNRPETEDINQDNTLNETEEYFQYTVNMQPNMQVGENYIVDKIEVQPNQERGPLTTETWYQFRIPIQDYSDKIGNIPDFKSIRFMRMFLTGFQDSVVLRFARLGLVRNQWRTYQYQLDTSGAYIPIDPNREANFIVSSVNLEENASRRPIPYVIPPGIQRQTQLSQNNVNQYLNEQSLSLEIKELKDGKARAVFKKMDVDLRKFGRLQMFIHAEAPQGNLQTHDGELQAVIRIGSDFINNYYEYRIPLKLTDPDNLLNPNTIWPDANAVDINLNMFPRLKQKRNQTGASVTDPYTIEDNKGNYVTVVGNPSLGSVRQVLLGILNPDENQTDLSNDQLPKSATVWFDELRVSDMEESGGYAATGHLNLQVADIGSIHLAGRMHTAGFGNVNQQLQERFKDNFYQYDVSANLQLGKLLPQNWRLSIPVYAGYSRTISKPEYDPYDLDIKLSDKLDMAKSKRARDSILEQAEKFTSITSLNLTNVRILPDPDKTTNHPWAPSNFNLSYSYSKMYSHNPLIKNDVLTRNHLGLGYNYVAQGKFIAPFRNLIGSSPYLALLKDININPIPSLISIRAEVDRQFGETNIRNIGGGKFSIPATFDKHFNFDRYYTLHWDLTKSINLDFQAVNYSKVDEPYGVINTSSKKDSVWTNLLNFGRPTMFNQTATASYTLPLQKFPLLDWVQINLNYLSNYQWTTGSLLTPYLGNIIENSSQKQLHANLDFNRLYNKSPFLKKINTFQYGSNEVSEENENTISPALKALMMPLLSIKRVSLKYSERSRTTLPGYLNDIGFMGQNWKVQKPGLKFAFGWQPNKQWLDQLGEEGWITQDTTLNTKYRQQFTQQFDIQATLEPLPSLVIDLRLHKSFSKNHSELFKKTDRNGLFRHLNPYDVGGFEVSFFSLKTLFDPIDEETGVSSTYKKFESYRHIISERLGEKNPYTNGATDPNNPDYAKGYGKYAEDVLI